MALSDLPPATSEANRGVRSANVKHAKGTILELKDMVLDLQPTGSVMA